MKLTRLVLPVVLTALVMPLTATPATAAQDAVSSEATAILDRIDKTGKVSDRDRETLKNDYPDLAAATIDPQAYEQVVIVEDAPELTKNPQGELTASANYCRTADIGVRARSTLGFTLFVFHQVLRWCYNGSTVYSVPTRYLYMSDVDPTISFRSLTTNNMYGVGTSRVTSTMQARLESCVLKYGCYGNSYPYVQIRGYGSGSYGYSRSV